MCLLSGRLGIVGRASASVPSIVNSTVRGSCAGLYKPFTVFSASLKQCSASVMSESVSRQSVL